MSTMTWRRAAPATTHRGPLALIHLAVAAVLIPALRRSAARQEAAS